jgi:orotate phosphoribosyltransferase
LEFPMPSPALTAFIDLLASRQALLFGDFTLKSGRKSPYFINMGKLCMAGDLTILGAAYAEGLSAGLGGANLDVVFGPAYKGIPLALAAAQGWKAKTGTDLGWCFDRKEAKTHGDGGNFVGVPLKAGMKLALVDDVLTAGTAVRESLAKLEPIGVKPAIIVVAVDRQETGPDGLTATAAVEKETGIPVRALVTVTQAAEHLHAAGRLETALFEQIIRHVQGAQK